MKWWFSDYDGTINVHHNDTLEPADLDFINDFVKKGNKFVIASGRMNTEIISMLGKNRLKYDFLIMNNGACVYDKNNNLIEHLSIPMTSRKAIWDLLQELKDQYIIGYCLENKRMDLTYTPTKEIDENDFLSQYAPSVNRFDEGTEDILNNESLNLLYFYINKNDVAKVKEHFKKIPGVKAVSTNVNVIEVMNEKASKAHGIEVVARHFHLKKEDIITSGDGENDIEMLEYTPNSFVMDTAWDHVKVKANQVIHRVCQIKDYIDY